MICQNCGNEFKGKFCPNCGLCADNLQIAGNTVEPAKTSSKPKGIGVSKFWLVLILAVITIIILIQLNHGSEKETIAEPTKPTESASFISELIPVTLNEQVMYDQGGVKITAVSLDFASSIDPHLKLLVENNTSNKVTLYVSNACINGVMVGFSEYNLGTAIAPGKKAYGEIVFSESDLVYAGILAIKDIELSLKAHDEAWTILSSGISHAITTVEESTIHTLDVSGIVVLDQEDIKIVFQDIDESDRSAGTQVELYIENNSDRNINLDFSEFCINGYTIDWYFNTISVFAGNAKYDRLIFSPEWLESQYIASLETMQFDLRVTDSETKEAIINNDELSAVFAPAADAATNIENAFTDSESTISVALNNQILIDHDGIKVTIVSINRTEDKYIQALLLIENNTVEEMDAFIEYCAIDGRMVITNFTSNINADTKRYETLTANMNDFTNDEIQSIQEIELRCSFYSGLDAFRKKYLDDETTTVPFVDDYLIISLKPSESSVQSITVRGQTVLDSNDVKVVLQGLHEEGNNALRILQFYIENKSTRDIRIDLSSLFIDGTLIDTESFGEVSAGGVSIERIMIDPGELYGNTVTSEQKLEIKLEMFDADSGNIIFDSDTISLYFRS